MCTSVRVVCASHLGEGVEGGGLAPLERLGLRGVLLLGRGGALRLPPRRLQGGWGGRLGGAVGRAVGRLGGRLGGQAGGEIFRNQKKKGKRKKWCDLIPNEEKEGIHV